MDPLFTSSFFDLVKLFSRFLKFRFLSSDWFPRDSGFLSKMYKDWHWEMKASVLSVVVIFFYV